MKKCLYKLVGLTSLGGALEFYDFTIYALFAPYISQHFLSNKSLSVSLMNTFTIFAVGYFARPLGGFFFGHLGDKWGRKYAFVRTVFTMAIATLLIGCLPTYSSIGIAAPCALILLRLAQGFSVGGEIPGASVFIIEHVPSLHHGFAIGFVLMCVTLGNTLGALPGWFLTTLLTPQQMLSYGWRIPFIIGFLLGIVGYFIRKKTPETPVFLAMQKNRGLSKHPFLTILKIAPSKLLCAFFITAEISSLISLFLYLPTFLSTTLKLPISFAYLVNVIAFFIVALMTTIFGWLSDYFNRLNVIITSTILTIIFSYPLFYGLTIYGKSFVWVFVVGFAVLASITNGSYVIIIAELFPANHRYSAVGVSFGLGLAVFGGLAPLIFTWMLNFFEKPAAPAFYIIGCAVLTLIALLNRIYNDKPLQVIS